MAVNVYQKVEKRGTGIVVSAFYMKYKASYGSLYKKNIKESFKNVHLNLLKTVHFRMYFYKYLSLLL